MTSKNNPGPSKSALRFLAWFCPASLYESIEGDLLEQFEIDSREAGDNKARRRFVWNSLKFFRPEILLRNSFDFFNFNQHIAMYRNYLIAAIRNIKRHKTISFINIFGLAICLSMGLIIMLTIKTEFSYDTFHTKADRIYSITTKIDDPDNPGHYAVSPPPLKAELLSKYPFIEQAANGIYSNYKYVLSGSQEIPASTIFTDNSYFKIFDVTALAGDASSWLTKPYSAILSQKAATKFFGREDPIGKPLTIQGWGQFTVTGLLADPSEKTRFEYEVYLSSSSIAPLVLQKKTDTDTDSWKLNYFSNTYVVLAPDAKRTDLDHALEQVSLQFAQEMNSSEKPVAYNFSSLKLNEIPPFDLSSFSGHTVGMPALLIFFLSMIALIFLLLAVFNYTNLTVARAFARSKEMGVRKITGASRSQIASQILTESVLMACLAMLIAFIMVRFLPWSENLTQFLHIDLHSFDLSLIGYATAFAFLAGIMAGFFPALIFSRINPIQSLNKLLNTRLFGSLKARNVMIVTQLTVSVIFLALLFVMDRQANYETTADLGYDRENLLTLNLHKASAQALRAEIEKHTAVVSTSAASGGPGWNSSMTTIENKNGERSRMDYFAADKNFIRIWGLTLLAGGNFPENISDSLEQFVIVNEKAVAWYNLSSPREAIGQFISIDSAQLQIVGVVQDFHANNLKWEIVPFALRHIPQEFERIMIKFQPGQESTVKAHVSSLWKAFEADFPIQLSLYDEEFTNHFSRPAEQLIIKTATLIAILTSCLGLLGVVLYSLETRTKEIAIRKVMGSSTIGLITVLSKNFFMLMIIALCIGLPLGYAVDFIILEEFAYKFELNTNLGLFVTGVLFAIGLLTICTQAIRATLANPVAALKND